MPCIVGEALNTFGTRQQKERYLRPTNEGKIYSAEALTEPRGGSDFFGATTKAVEDGDSFIINGEKRFVVGAKDSDYFLVYAKSAPDAPPHESLSCFIVERAMGVEDKTIYTGITVVLVGPLFEEILFRGMILDGFLKRYSPWKSILWSSVIFCLFHIFC